MRALLYLCASFFIYAWLCWLHNSFMFELSVMSIWIMTCSTFQPPNSRFLICKKSINVHCYVDGFMPPNYDFFLWKLREDPFTTLKNSICSQAMLCQGSCECSQRSTFVATLGKLTKNEHLSNFDSHEESLHSTLRAQHFHGTFSFFSPCTRANLWAPLWPPSARVGFWKIDNRNTPTGCERLRHETLLHPTWFPHQVCKHSITNPSSKRGHYVTIRYTKALITFDSLWKGF